MKNGIIRKMLFALGGVVSSFAMNAVSADVLPGLVVPGYGPGAAGNVSVGPTQPVCVVGQPCTQPLVNAHVQLLDRATRKLVGQAVTNAAGNFIASVPAGIYVAHVDILSIYPRCPEADVLVTSPYFTLIHIQCDSGIR